MRFRARVRMSNPGGKVVSKTEAAYGAFLETRKIAGEIADYRHAALKLQLAPLTTYAPDYLVILPSGEVEMHEVKGFWEGDARVKIKVAADRFPWFRFVAVTKAKGTWNYEEFP